MVNTIAERLQCLGHQLPVPARPAANYVPWTQSGDLIFISGQLGHENGRVALVGRLGDTVSVEQGRRAAELCALQLLAQIADASNGALSRVRKILRLGGFVSCVPGFDRHSEVMNGASDLMIAVFGERGRHARTAVGVPSLPRGAAVEVDAVVQVAVGDGPHVD